MNPSALQITGYATAVTTISVQLVISPLLLIQLAIYCLVSTLLNQHTLEITHYTNFYIIDRLTYETCTTLYFRSKIHHS